MQQNVGVLHRVSNLGSTKLTVLGLPQETMLSGASGISCFDDFRILLGDFVNFCTIPHFVTVENFASIFFPKVLMETLQAMLAKLHMMSIICNSVSAFCLYSRTHALIPPNLLVVQASNLARMITILS